ALISGAYRVLLPSADTSAIGPRVGRLAAETQTGDPASARSSDSTCGVERNRLRRSADSVAAKSRTSGTTSFHAVSDVSSSPSAYAACPSAARVLQRAGAPTSASAIGT